MGFPFRPSPTAQATILYEFGPRASNVDSAPGFPETPDFDLFNWAVCADSATRVDFSTDLAAQFQRMWGYVASVDESPAAENTDTGYLFEIVRKSTFRIKDFGTFPAEVS